MTCLRQLLRSDLLLHPHPEGLLLVDLLRELSVELDLDEALALSQDPDSDFEAELLRMRLESEGLLEGPAAERLRQATCQARMRQTRPLAPPSSPCALASFEAARDLPEWLDPSWRTPERWRRLAEQARAGERYLRLEAFLRPEMALELREQLLACPFEPLHTDLVHAERIRIQDAHLPKWRSFLASAPLRHLVSEVLARPINSGLVMNAWRLQEGDFMGVHPDGPHYQGTFSLGLSEAWSAAYGGAIAFGQPGGAGFEVSSRWFPHLGDACLFAPDASTWHAVERVKGPHMRLSLTSWWTGALGVALR